MKFWTLAALGAALLPAAPTDPWLRIQSRNFELFTTAGERTGRDMVNHFEQVRAFFYEAFGSQPTAARPARIIVFRSEKEYQPFRPSQTASAFYQPGADHDFIVMMKTGAGVEDVAVHEYTHLLVGQSGQKDIPIWLNEGLAELYSNLEPRGGRIVVGKPLPGRGQALASEKWIPVRRLLTVDHDSPYYQEKTRAGMFYAESWILVHMLVLGREYRPRLRVMLEELKHGDSARALETAYGKSVEEIEKDLRSYMGQSMLAAAVFNGPAEPEGEVRVDRAAGMSARLALAELLAVTPGRGSQARATYQQIQRDYPNRWEVEQELAEFDLMERRNSEAAEHFAIAAELGARSPRMYVRYARALTLTNRDDDAIKALKTAASLDPASDEARYELGMALVRAGQFRQAVDELGRIRKLGPEQAPRYYYSFAFAAYKSGDKVRARALIREARKYTRNPEELAALDKLSETVGK